MFCILLSDAVRVYICTICFSHNEIYFTVSYVSHIILHKQFGGNIMTLMLSQAEESQKN